MLATFCFGLFLPWYGKTCVYMYDDIVRGLRTLKPLYLRATGAMQRRGEELVITRTSLQTKGALLFACVHRLQRIFAALYLLL